MPVRWTGAHGAKGTLATDAGVGATYTRIALCQTRILAAAHPPWLPVNTDTLGCPFARSSREVTNDQQHRDPAGVTG